MANQVGIALGLMLPSMIVHETINVTNTEHKDESLLRTNIGKQLLTEHVGVAVITLSVIVFCMLCKFKN
jgi:hypothetical protein